MITDASDWIDLLEGEMDEASMSQLEVVLRRSPESRKEFLKLSRLRDAVLATDPKANERRKINSKTYQQILTNKVMQKIHQESRKTKSSLKKDNSLKIERDSSTS